MSELTPEERAFIDAASGGEDPSPDVRKRVKGAVLARVAAGAVGTAIVSTAATTASAGASAVTKLLVVSTLVLASTGGAIYATTSRSPTPGQAAAGLAPHGTALARETKAAVATAEPPVAATAEPAQPPPSSSARPARSAPEVSPPDPARTDDLRAELDLLREAQKELRNGNAARALGLLDEHAARYPNGALSPERRGTRVLALCQLGQAERARAEADRFLAQSPESPLAERVRRACPAR